MARKVRHVPQRMCVGCRKLKPKRDLIRVVRRPDGSVELDTQGRTPGRGAYLCPQIDCLQTATRNNQLERALATSVHADTIQQLEERLKDS